MDQDDLVLAGALEKITFKPPDNLAFALELIGEESEEVSCEFCWFGPKPFCADIVDNDGDGNCIPFDEISNSDCIAESMINSCDSISCGSAVGHVGLFSGNCELVDCGTLACERIEFVHGGFLTARPGTLTDIQANGFGGLSGTMNRDGQEASFDCGIMVP